MGLHPWSTFLNSCLRDSIYAIIPQCSPPPLFSLNEIVLRLQQTVKCSLNASHSCRAAMLCVHYIGMAGLTREGKKVCAIVSFSTLSLREKVPREPAGRKQLRTRSWPRLATMRRLERELSGIKRTGAPASMSSNTRAARCGRSRTCRAESELKQSPLKRSLQCHDWLEKKDISLNLKKKKKKVIYFWMLG